MIALASIKLAMVLILKSLSESTGGKWVGSARPKWVEPIRAMGQIGRVNSAHFYSSLFLLVWPGPMRVADQNRFEIKIFKIIINIKINY